MNQVAEQPQGEELRATGIRVYFEGLKAIDGVDFVLGRGKIFGLIGPNGAGKTTLVNVLSGFQRPTAGSVMLSGADITRKSPHHRARKGLARTFQGIRLFSRLTVFENVEAGAVGARIPRSEARDLVWELLDVMRLADKASLPATSLPHGEERRVGIARALATQPRFLLLDEPAAGLNEAEADDLVHRLAALPTEFGLGLLVIDHDMRFIMQVCERIQVLDYGKTIALNTPSEIAKDPAVLDAYLGRRREQAQTTE